MIEKYLIKSGDLYYDGFNAFSANRKHACIYQCKSEAANTIKFLCNAKLKIVKLKRKKQSVQPLVPAVFKPILDENSSLKDLSFQVVEAFFAGQATNLEDMFYDKMVALSNKLNKES